MADNDDWDGSERRSIPIHILNHIDGRISEVKEDIAHIRDSIKHLNDSINSWMDKEPGAILEQCEKIVDEAIPVSKDNPDATPHEKRREHRRAHAKWIANVEGEMERWKKMREKVAEWAVISILTALVMWVIWSIQTYLGKPPHP